LHFAIRRTAWPRRRRVQRIRRDLLRAELNREAVLWTALIVELSKSTGVGPPSQRRASAPLWSARRSNWKRIRSPRDGRSPGRPDASADATKNPDSASSLSTRIQSPGCIPRARVEQRSRAEPPSFAPCGATPIARRHHGFRSARGRPLASLHPWLQPCDPPGRRIGVAAKVWTQRLCEMWRARKASASPREFGRVFWREVLRARIRT
jgi:hypothetical protein